MTYLVKPSDILYENCFKISVFPQSLRISKIILIYKKVNISSQNSYQSTSFIHIIIKMFESVINTQTVKITKSNQQYGFHSGKNTGDNWSTSQTGLIYIGRLRALLRPPCVT